MYENGVNIILQLHVVVVVIVIVISHERFLNYNSLYQETLVRFIWNCWEFSRNYQQVRRNVILSHKFSWNVILSHKFSWNRRLSHKFSWNVILSHEFPWNVIPSAGSETWQSTYTFQSLKIVNENLTIVKLLKSRVVMNESTYVGICFLDISKVHMYNFHYNVTKKQYGNKSRLLFTDTDNLTYIIETPNIYADMRLNMDLYETSDYPTTCSIQIKIIKSSESPKTSWMLSWPHNS